MKPTDKNDRFRRYSNRALLVFGVLLMALAIRACNQSVDAALAAFHMKEVARLGRLPIAPAARHFLGRQGYGVAAVALAARGGGQQALGQGLLVLHELAGDFLNK